MEREHMAIDDLIDLAGRDIERITRRFYNGRVNVWTYRREMRRIIRTAHAGAEELGRLGRPLNFWQRWVNEISLKWNNGKQFRFLEGMIRDIRAGKYEADTMLGSLINRAKMYANAAMQTHQDRLRSDAQAQRLTRKRRVLEPGADHCKDCLDQAGLGWVDINDPSVTDVGDTQCGANDRCVIIYE